jgi:hypothetical protein
MVAGVVHGQENANQVLLQDEDSVSVTVNWDPNQTELVNATPTIDSNSWHIRFQSNGPVNRQGAQDVRLVIENITTDVSFLGCTFSEEILGSNFAVSYPSCATGNQDTPQQLAGDTIFSPGHTFVTYFTDLQGNIINDTENGQGIYNIGTIPEGELEPGLFTINYTIIPHPDGGGSYIEAQVFTNETIPNQTLDLVLRTTSSGALQEFPLGELFIVEGEQVFPTEVPENPLPSGSYELVVIHNESEYQVTPITPALVSDTGSVSNPGSGLGLGSGFSLNSIQTDIISGGIVPDCGYNIRTQANETGTGRMCGISDLIILIQRVIEYIFILILPIAAIVFAYVGFLFLTSGGNTDKKTKAKKAMTNLVIGIVLVLAAWLIVQTVLTALGVDTSIARQFLDVDGS